MGVTGGRNFDKNVYNKTFTEYDFCLEKGHTI